MVLLVINVAVKERGDKMKIEVRKIIPSDRGESGEEVWIFFETGNMSKPLFILHEYDAGYLLKGIIRETEKKVEK